MHLLKNLFLSILLLTIFQSCKEKSTENSPIQTVNTSSEESLINKDIENANSKWKDLLNLKSDSLSNLYAEHAIKIFEDGTTMVGRQPIVDFYHTVSYSVNSFHSDTILMANAKRGLEYEMSEYTDNSNTKCKQIVIWEGKDSERERVFEFAVEMDETGDNLSEIDNRRDQWIKLCNMNNAENLINEMYSQNTLYFNHKPLVTGRKSLIEEYAYMNRENYELTLSPIIVDQVNQNLVFEIGQCKGSYNGKYIIIWRKEASGKWEVFIDSNI